MRLDFLEKGKTQHLLVNYIHAFTLKKNLYILP